MSNIQAALSRNSYRRLKRDMSLLSLTKEQKTRLFQRTLWRMKDKAKKAVREQRSPDGTPWQKRKKGSGKMLKRRARFLKSKPDGENRAKLGYSVAKTAQISAQHQYGLEAELVKNQKLTAAEKKILQFAKDKQVTDSQAKKLRDLGYHIILKGGRKKRASMREIKAQLKQGQAGLIIRLMSKKSNEKNKDKSSSNNGKIKMPARPFLDENTQRNAEIMTAELIKLLTPQQ